MLSKSISDLTLKNFFNLHTIIHNDEQDMFREMFAILLKIKS